jgi:hypothetical protein
MQGLNEIKANIDVVVQLDLKIVDIIFESTKLFNMHAFIGFHS